MEKPRVGIIGANGFIGSRVVELFHLSGYAHCGADREAGCGARKRIALCSGRPRRGRTGYASFDSRLHGLRLCRSRRGWRPANNRKDDRACVSRSGGGGRPALDLFKQRVRAWSVTAAGHSEASELNDRQSIDYNNAKVRAELRLAHLRQLGKVEVAVLRPGSCMVRGRIGQAVCGRADRRRRVFGRRWAGDLQ